MKKSEVYSWRVAPETKVALELEARREGQSVAALLDRMTREWLTARRRGLGQDKAEQARLQAAAAKVLGTIAGGDPRRAERARAALQKRLANRRGR